MPTISSLTNMTESDLSVENPPCDARLFSSEAPVKSARFAPDDAQLFSSEAPVSSARFTPEISTRISRLWLSPA
jgi:hypothetical protein